MKSRPVNVARQTEKGRFPPGHSETDATRAFPQFQGHESQDYPRDDHKYDRANVGGGTGDDIPAKVDASLPAQSVKPERLRRRRASVAP